MKQTFTIVGVAAIDFEAGTIELGTFDIQNPPSLPPHQPPPVVVPPVEPPAPSGDQLDLSSAQIVNAPDVRSWPMTAKITEVSFDGSTTRVNFTKRDGPGRWPDVTPAGWEGPLQYTLWLFLKINDAWVGSGFIQMWSGRDGSGSSSDPDVPSRYSEHWYYSDRWSPMPNHGPIRAGEPIGIMVTSGNARDSVGPFGPSERSNVVVISATDNGRFTW